MDWDCLVILGDFFIKLSIYLFRVWLPKNDGIEVTSIFCTQSHRRVYRGTQNAFATRHPSDLKMRPVVIHVVDLDFDETCCMPLNQKTRTI